MMEVAGTDGTWARRLPEVLQKHGFTEVHADGEVQFFNDGSLAAELYQLTWLQCRDKLLQQNRPSPSPFASGIEKLADPHFWAMSPVLIGVRARREPIV